MKKSALSLALLCAFASAAHAESNVQVYGLMDAGVDWTTNSNAAGNSQMRVTFPALTFSTFHLLKPTLSLPHSNST